jgi:hypothetical protein
MKRWFFIIGLLLAFASSLANAQTALPHYAVNLAWLAPTVSNDPVAAYEVFRAPSGSTAYQSLTGNAPSTATLTYIDGTVLPSTTYNYIVESTDAQGNLSSPSNVANATLPALLPIGTLVGHTT